VSSMRPRLGRQVTGWIVLAMALLLFGWLADEILRGEKPCFDSVVRDTVHEWASPQLTYSIRGITLLGSSVFLIGMSVVVGWRLAGVGRRNAAVLLLLAVVGAQLLDEMLKLVFHRQRPAAFFGYQDPASYSFPSGHAFSSSCFYGVLAAIVGGRMDSRRRILVWATVAFLVLLIGFSRVYLGVHYPSDVLAGYAAAVIWIGALRGGYKVWLRRCG
jgi:membrane-associated phospholipid phosphatase